MESFHDINLPNMRELNKEEIEKMHEEYIKEKGIPKDNFCYDNYLKWLITKIEKYTIGKTKLYK